jgi:site-specific recombinase XerC
MIAEDAGIQKRVYPHLLRHSDAVERLRQTGNPKVLQLDLGHSSSFPGAMGGVAGKYVATPFSLPL